MARNAEWHPAGDQIVRLVYADEAGLSHPAHEPHLVVASVIIDADKKLIAVQRHLDKLVQKHIPAEFQADFVFHAMHLFNGGGKVFVRDDPDDPNPKWPLAKRLEIAREVGSIPQKFGLPVALGWVARSEWPQTFSLPDGLKQREIDAWCHVGAYITCAMQVDHWMRKNTQNEVCLMIVEDNDNARKLIKENQRYHQDPRLRQTLSPSSQKHFPFRTIKQDPLFEPKSKSSPLQIADFCAYVWKRMLMNQTDPLYAPIYDLFRKQVTYGA